MTDVVAPERTEEKIEVELAKLAPRDVSTLLRDEEGRDIVVEGLPRANGEQDSW